MRVRRAITQRVHANGLGAVPGVDDGIVGEVVSGVIEHVHGSAAIGPGFPSLGYSTMTRRISNPSSGQIRRRNQQVRHRKLSSQEMRRRARLIITAAGRRRVEHRKRRADCGDAHPHQRDDPAGPVMAGPQQKVGSDEP